MAQIDSYLRRVMSECTLSSLEDIYDLYSFVGTKLEDDAFELMRKQLMLDVQCKTPSLLAKWLKSENTSSAESRALANKTRIAFNMNHKELLYLEYKQMQHPDEYSSS